MAKKKYRRAVAVKKKVQVAAVLTLPLPMTDIFLFA
jgi:hypothetical protein